MARLMGNPCNVASTFLPEQIPTQDAGKPASYRPSEPALPTLTEERRGQDRLITRANRPVFRAL